MVENIEAKRAEMLEEIIKHYKEGDKFEADGYEDLGFTIKRIAFQDALTLFPYLSEEDRKKLKSVLFYCE